MDAEPQCRICGRDTKIERGVLVCGRCLGNAATCSCFVLSAFPEVIPDDSYAGVLDGTAR